MRGVDGAEVCELVGSFLLHQLSNEYNKRSLGLYIDTHEMTVWQFLETKVAHKPIE